MSPILLMTIYLSLTALTAWMADLCLRRWERTAGTAGRLRKFWMLPCALLSLLPVAGAFLPDGPLKFALQAAGNVWLGFFLYFGLLLLTLLLVALLLRRVSGGRLARRWHGGILCLSLAAALALAGYGLIHARDTRVERFGLEIDKPAGELESLRVALIGDLHLSVNADPEVTRRMVERINAEDPDVVLVAGDVFTSSYAGLSRPEAYAEALRGIESRYGVYAVYGNHDVEETLFGGFPISPVSQAFRSAEMEAFFRDAGFAVLCDEAVTLGGGVQLVGRVDGDKAGDGTRNRLSARELLANVDGSLPVLVLEHEPREFQALKEAGADVALCGHTHAGQLFPGNLVVPLFNENAWGYKRVHGLDTFVTAGVGCYGPPMRVGTDSEITVIDLRFNGGKVASDD